MKRSPIWDQLAHTPVLDVIAVEHVHNKTAGKCALQPDVMTAPVRPDALPEHANYPDEGCDVSPTCLNCPLPVCKFDYPAIARAYVVQRFRRGVLAESMLRDHAAGMVVAAVAQKHGVSTRTVYRAIAGAHDDAIPEITVRSLRERFRPSWVPTLRISA